MVFFVGMVVAVIWEITHVTGVGRVNASVEEE